MRLAQFLHSNRKLGIQTNCPANAAVGHFRIAYLRIMTHELVWDISPLSGVLMTKTKETKPENHTDHPYDNGAIGAIASVTSAGVAVGAALGIAAELPGLLIGAAIGGTVGAIGSLIVAEEMDHPLPKPS